MDKKRKLELLAYAAECFNKNTNPFETVHLVQKHVTAEECFDLSQLIFQIIHENLFENYRPQEITDAKKQATADFAASQERL